jgi:polysaccharide biosynthesis transport protein
MTETSQQVALPLSSGTPASVRRIDQTAVRLQRLRLLLKRRWWFLLLCVSVGVCISVLRVIDQPSSYISGARLVAGGQFEVANLGVRDQGGAEFYGTQIEIMRSDQVRRAAKERVKLLRPDLREEEVSVSVTKSSGASMFNLRAEGSGIDFEREYVKVYLNALIDEYLAFRQDVRKRQVDEALNAITQELMGLERKLDQVEAERDQFLRENSLLVLEDGGNQAAEYLKQLNGERARLDGEVRLMERLTIDQDIERRQRGLGLSPEGATGGEPGAEAIFFGLGSAERQYMQTRQLVTEMQFNLQRLLSSLKPAHPDVQAAQEQLVRELARLEIYRVESEKEAEQRKESMRIRLQALDEEIANWQQRALDASAKLSEYENLTARYERHKKRYDESLTLLEDVDMNIGMTREHVAVLERADVVVEQKPDWRRPLVVAGVVGLLIGLVLLLLMDRLDDRMNSYAEFQTSFPNLAVLGQVPQQRFKGQSALISPNDERHLYAEAYRNLRSSLLFKNWEGKVPKVVLVTSAVPNEGKTTVAGNLAITMALGGSRILLVDGDLRRGGLNELISAPAKPGLSEILVEGLPWRDALVPTAIDNLQFMPRGDALDRPSEVLLRGGMDDFLKEVRKAFDLVIFDSAPVLVADDTASLAPKVDASLLVVRMGTTMARLTAKAMGVLADRQVRVAGVVLNQVAANLREYSYYNYASYYTVRPVAASPAVEATDSSAS